MLKSKCGLLFLSLKKLIQLSLCMLCPLDQVAQVNDRTGALIPTFLAAQTCNAQVRLLVRAELWSRCHECLQTMLLRIRLVLQPFLSPAVAQLLLSSLLHCLIVQIISFCSLITISFHIILVCWGNEGAGGSIVIRTCLMFTSSLP